MKNNLIILAIFVSIFIISGCEYDNYEPPKSFLKGNIVFNGKPIGVRSNGTQLELWQYGYQLRTKINVFIDQNGSFSARLFEGNYKIVRLAGAPWENQTDSIDVSVKGNVTIEIPVIPYFTIENSTFVYDLASKTISVNCNISKTGSKTIEKVSLYIGTTAIVDATNNVSLINKTTGIQDLSIPITVISAPLTTNLAARDYIFVRVGVKATGVAELCYSDIQRIKLR